MRVIGKYSTSTITGSGSLVPWLAAAGPLSYTPNNPPVSDYYFQYGWVLPEVLSAGEDHRHRYFGVASKHAAAEVFAFWDDARHGRHVPVQVGNGKTTPDSVSAPIAAYLQRRPRYGRGIPYLLIQHGSYLFASRKDQPEMEQGVVYLYRGIQKAEAFHYPEFDVSSLCETDRKTWRAYMAMQATLLSDSVRSFVSMHERINRCETGGLNSSSNIALGAAHAVGLGCYDRSFGQMLWNAHRQCFSLERMIAERKFGPNFVILKTPLDNIRITTFFAGEAEVKVIDPARVKCVSAVGCDYMPTALCHA